MYTGTIPALVRTPGATFALESNPVTVIVFTAGNILFCGPKTLLR
jgi:hypothetical protein